MSHTTIPTAPAASAFKVDAEGRLVPIANIKPVDLLRDELVHTIAGRAKALNAQLREMRTAGHDDIRAFCQLSAEQYGAIVGGKKGNLVLRSFDGRYMVQRQICDALVFDERLQAAKELIDACITEWAEGANDNIRVLITSAFQVDKQGQINTGRVLSLRRLKIDDPRWKAAMEAISDSLQVATSRSYIRIYERVGNTDQYRPINLDLANA